MKEITPLWVAWDTWIYNRTKGSLLMTLLFHAAINTTGLFLPRSFPMILVVCTLTAAIVAIKEKMWKRLPSTCLSVEGSL